MMSLTKTPSTMFTQDLTDKQKAEKLANKIRNYFPNFPKVEVTSRNSVKVKIKNHSWSHFGNLDRNWMDIRSDLIPKYRKMTVENQLGELYPSLSISVFDRKEGTMVNAWIKSSGTALGEVGMLHHADTYDELRKLNTKAKAIAEGDYFWCSGHERVEPKECYSYYHFASKYCEEWKHDNPQHYRKAMNEDYS